MRRTLRLTAAAALLPLALAACGGGDADEASSSGTQISYWLWDSNQLPAYEACADDFAEANPGTTVKIEQFGWEDYWSKITTGMVSGTMPDVFTNHLNYYPTFAAQNQILALDELVAEDQVPTDIYPEGLADLWVTQEGKRYGLPKDFDTVAVFFNKAMLADAGLTEADMASLDWNPEDGGTYEDVIARLTVDENGVRGDQPGFDKSKVAVHGLGLENAGAGLGQQMWAPYALTTGWQYTDKNPWGTEFEYDDPRFQETVAWFRSLIEKGYMPPLSVATSGVSVNDAFAAGKSAMNTNGSWMIGAYHGYDEIDVGMAPTPTGPTGERASVFNGLADSIYAGTENEDAAWAWVKYLASPECQRTVGEAGVVFPAIPEALDVAETTFAEKGIDITPFTVQIDEGTTHLFPITENAPDVTAIMTPAMDAVMSFEAEPGSLSEANEQVNALFQ